jgi:hypothetical protein
MSLGFTATRHWSSSEMDEPPWRRLSSEPIEQSSRASKRE